jgi:hypothetical protein
MEPQITKAPAGGKNHEDVIRDGNDRNAPTERDRIGARVARLWAIGLYDQPLSDFDHRADRQS